MSMPWQRQKGLSLIEMMIALAVAGITIAGVYKIFANQQKSLVVQEEVSDAQQSARAVMDIISRDIRMAGFGMPGWTVGGLTNQIRIDQSSPADFTVVGVFSEPIAKLANPASMGQTQIVLDTMGQPIEMTKGDNLLVFESDRSVPPILSAGQVLAPPLRYRTVVVWTSINGSDPMVDIDADGETGAVRDSLPINLRANALVYRVGTVNYHLVGNTLTRNGSVLATNVAGLQIIDQFNPGPPPVPETYGSYQIVLTVNTQTNDPDFPGATRARTLTSTIKARNLVFQG